MTTIILGMHRSGTSVLGNILSELGWSVGLSPMLPGEDNPQGFFENISIMQLHDTLLFQANSTWSDPHPFPSDWWTQERLTYWADQIRVTLAKEFPDHPQRLIKDPRMCRLLPPWRKALGEEWEKCHFLLPVRHPLEVAYSLEARDGMSLEYGVLLWLTHFFESENQTRGANRLILLQNHLIEGLENQNLAEFLGCDPQRIAAAHQKAVRPGLRHHSCENQAVFPGSKLGEIAEKAWHLTNELLHGVDVKARIDGLRTEFDDHVGFVPREFSGISTTNPSSVLHRVASHLHASGGSSAIPGHKTIFLKMEGDFFSVEFEGVAEGAEELIWTVDLPGPCEMAIHNMTFSGNPITWTETNASGQKGTLAKFLGGNAKYQLVIHQRPSPQGNAGHSHVLQIQGILRMLAPETASEEFNRLAITHERWIGQFEKRWEAQEQLSKDVAELRARLEEGLLEFQKSEKREQENSKSVLESIGREIHAIAELKDSLNAWEQKWATLQPMPAVVVESRIQLQSLLQEIREISQIQKLNFSRIDELDRMESSVGNQTEGGITIDDFAGNLAARWPEILTIIPSLRHARKTLQASGLFDPGYYRSQVGCDGQMKDPQLHYLVAGSKWGLNPSALIESVRLKRIVRQSKGRRSIPLICLLENRANHGFSPSALFDAQYYLQKYPDAGGSGNHPLVHYIQEGAKQGCKPSPLFDTEWYTARYPEVAEYGRSPLEHYLIIGAKKGYNPNPLFDSSWYTQKTPEVRIRGINPLLHYMQEGERKGYKPHPLFDPMWYAANNPCYAQTEFGPLAHCLETGARMGCGINPLFDSEWYLKRYPEVAQAGIPPMFHYLSTGARQGFNPNPLFDSAWYTEKYAPGAGADFNPLVHYLDTGSRYGFNPNPLFDGSWYFAKYPDAIHEQTDPLRHYMEIGAARGYQPHPLFDGEWYTKSCPDWTGPIHGALAHFLLVGGKEGGQPHALFDPSWYVEQYLEVKSAGYNPLLHFLASGASDGYSPHPLFDSRWYLEQYPQVKDAGYNPLLHYLASGAAEGYNPHPLFDSAWYMARYHHLMEPGISSLVHYVTHWAEVETWPNPLFDTGHYLGQCPEVRDQAMPPLVHYLLLGERNGLMPHVLFDPAYYLREYPEVADCGINPLAHYLATAAYEGRNPSAWFEGDYYLRTYPEVRKAGIHPLIHYWDEGGFMGYSPNHVFDGKAYLEAYPEVNQAGYNPLYHYLISGEKEGRVIPGRFDPVHYRKQLDDSWQGRSLLEHYLLFGEKQGLSPVSLEVLYDLHMPKYVVLPAVRSPLVSIVIPVYNQSSFTVNCLYWISQIKTDIPYEVIIVDDCSTDDTPSIALRAFNVRYVRNETNKGFGETCNRGAKEAAGEFLFFLNNDTKVTPGYLEALVETARMPKVGYVGCKLIYPNGLLQEAGGVIWNDGSAWNYGNGQDPSLPIFNYLRKADYCSAAAALVPRRLFLDLGGFSPEYERAYYEDTDLCMRIREAGYDVVYQPAAEVHHFEGGTCGKDVTTGVKKYQAINREVFLEKWRHTLEGHPEDADVPGHFRHLYPAGTILFIDDLLPMPKISSGGLRAWNIIRILLDLGHHVTFIPAYPCADPGELQEALQRLGVQVLGPPDYPTAQQWITEDNGIFALQKFDKVILARHYIARELYATIRDRMPEARIIFDTVDLHYVRLRREAEISRDPGTSARAETAYKEEMELLRTCDQTWVVSHEEKAELQRMLPDANVHVVSNIVSVPGTTKGWGTRSGILFIGGYNHPPNQDAVLWFAKEIYPRVVEAIPDVVFHILGSHMPEEFFLLASDHIHPVGFVDDPEPWFEKVRLSVAPLRYGAGVKGKVNQSLSLGVPVVGTSVALEGMGIPSGSCVLCADDPELMAEHIIQLYKNKSLWEDFSVTGIRSMNEMYSMKSGSMSVEAALSEISGCIS